MRNSFRPTMSLIEGNPDQVALSIELEPPWDLQNVPYHAQGAEAGKARLTSGQQITQPQDQQISQLGQQEPHFLSGKGALGAVGQLKPLFGVADGSFNPPAALVIAINRIEQLGQRLIMLLL